MDNIQQEKLKNLIRSLEKSASPQEAEYLMGEILVPLLAEDGYSIQAVGDQRDFGVDFIARKDKHEEQFPEEIAIEYKHYRKAAVGLDVVHRVLGAAMSMGLSRAMVITNSRFTYAAREAIR